LFNASIYEAMKDLQMQTMAFNGLENNKSADAVVRAHSISDWHIFAFSRLGPEYFEKHDHV
jgi:hypothetical protein